MWDSPLRTPYDIRFRCCGFPVRVHPLFWLAAALLGGDLIQSGLHYWLLWMLVVFVALLVHELGHAVAYRVYGCQAAIILWIFGGLTVADRIPGRHASRIIVSLAGPFSGFALAGLLYITQRLTAWQNDEAPHALIFTYQLLILVNVYWGILNLVPVLPLDGGQVCRDVCEWIRPTKGAIWAWQISLWTASLLALYSLMCWWETTHNGGPLTRLLPVWFPKGSWWTAVLFALLALQSYQHLHQRTHRSARF
ncbi:MAG: site-2 protease family protein [Gemmataceae bacterium]|nr:site-2 protease family protein [Gemmataceae bacterium]